MNKLIRCKVCEDIICKSEKKWTISQGMQIQVNRFEKEELLVDICKSCYIAIIKNYADEKI